MSLVRSFVSIGVAVSALAAASARADTSYIYDFSGDLGSQFSPLVSTGLGSVGQNGGQLTFSTVGPASADESGIWYGHVYQPTFSQAWSAQVTAYVPTGMNNPNTVAQSADYYGEVDVFARFVEADGTAHAASAFLGVWNQKADRHYAAQLSVTPSGGDWTPLDQGYESTVDTSGVLSLSFNPTTKTLTVASSHQVLANWVLTGANSWNMGANDQFQIGIGFDVQGYQVPGTTPLALDNFTLNAYTAAAPQVPEPQTVALLLAGLGVITAVARRRAK